MALAYSTRRGTGKGEHSMTIEYTNKEMQTAYSRLLYAEGLIDFVLGTDLNLNSDQAEMEGSLTSIFSILKDYLSPAMDIMANLDMGHMVRKNMDVIEPKETAAASE
jgi:hypothetical protein